MLKIKIVCVVIGAALFFADHAAAQEYGIALYKQAKQQEERANERLAKSYVSPLAKPEAAELFTVAGSNYLHAAKVLKPLSNYALFAAARSFTKAAEAYVQLDEYEKAAAVGDSIMKAWPRFFSISMEEVMQPKNIRERGATYMLSPETTEGEFRDFYFRGRAAAAEAAFVLGKLNKARELAEEVSRAFGMPHLTWKARYILSEAYLKGNQMCKAADEAIISLEHASLTQPDPDTAVIRACNLCIDKLINTLDNSQAQNCISKDDEERVAIALAGLKSRWDTYADAAFRYGEQAYQHNSRSHELMVAMIRTAERMENNDEKNKWLGRLDEAKKNATSEEWYEVSDLYAEMGKTEEMTEAARKGYRKWAWENTHIAVSTNPWQIYKKQYPIAIDIIRPNVSHELMFTHIKQQNLLQLPSDILKFDYKDASLTFSGYMFSYGMKFLIPKRTDKDFYSYIGPNVRYTKRDFFTEEVRGYNKAEQGAPGPITISPTGSAYDLTVVFGQLQKINWMFFDIYAGFGIGYKSMKVDLPGGLDAYSFEDYKYNPATWNKLYVPLRAGFRIGIAVK